MRSADRALSGAPGAFLAPGFAATAANFAAGTRRLGAASQVGLMVDNRPFQDADRQVSRHELRGNFDRARLFSVRTKLPGSRHLRRGFRGH